LFELRVEGVYAVKDQGLNPGKGENIDITPNYYQHLPIPKKKR